MRRTAGTGGNVNIVGHIFFSHVHWDHVQGFPFFAPAYRPGNAFHLYGGSGLNPTIRRIMNDQMSQPNFPVTLEQMGASLTFHDLDPGEIVKVDDATIRVALLNHPGGSLGYRVERGGKVIVYASDTELDDGADAGVVDLAGDADVLVIDGMYTPDQYCGTVDGIPRKSWGHSTWEEAAAVAQAARVQQLVLYHHGNDDKTVEEIEQRARERFPRTIAAFEGLEIEI